MGPEFRKLQSDHDILYKGRHQAIQWKKIGINNNFNINRKQAGAELCQAQYNLD